MVPIGIEAPVGAIGVYWPVVREATAAEAEYLQALANSTATAMETLQRNVQPDARTRLSGSAARAGFLANDEIIPGTLLDERYRLDEKIGVGGYGAVYRGHDLFDDRPIAVKVCRPQATLIDQNAIERFFREGLWTSRVRHPNAVEVYAYSVTSDSVPYLVMELLNGRTLAQELRICTRLSLSRTLPILEQSALALAAAHEQGILHRDIKPDNLFLHTTPDGKVVAKLLDFGSAKPLDTQVGEPFNALTAAGQVLGTPHFIAPERWTNQNVDGRSDVYSLGVSMMVALEGYVSLRQTQFQAVVSSHSELVTAVYTAPVGHTAVSQRPQLPLLVVQLMERAMNIDPLLRPTAAEFATEIHQLHAALPADQ